MAKFDPDTRAKILKALSMNAGLTRAAEMSQVSREAVRQWMRRGERDLAEGNNTTYARFVVDVRDAEATMLSLAEGSIAHAMVKKKDWRAAAWLLERKLPSEYGNRTTVTVEHKQEMARELLEHLRSRLDANTYERVLAALSEDGGDAAEALH